MNRLSERLSHIARMVDAGGVLADVGCDHGYLSIELVKSGRVRRAIATDVNKGPLLRAAEHIAQEKLGDYIETRLSDGLGRISPGEIDAAVMAGMGGALMIDLLRRGRDVVEELQQLILEPQSELATVRAYARSMDYRIAAEDLVLEDGKYYPILRLLPQEKSDTADFAKKSGLAVELLDAYGHRLLEECHPVLRSFLEREKRQCELILRELSRADAKAERTAARKNELRARLEQNRAAYAYMEGAPVQKTAAAHGGPVYEEGGERQ